MKEVKRRVPLWCQKINVHLRKRKLKIGKDDEVNGKFIYELYKKQKGRCFYTGLLMNVDEKLYQPSLDRIDSSVGYTVNNVVLCCLAINYAKNDSSRYEFEKFLEKLRD